MVRMGYQVLAHSLPFISCVIIYEFCDVSFVQQPVLYAILDTRLLFCKGAGLPSRLQWRQLRHLGEDQVPRGAKGSELCAFEFGVGSLDRRNVSKRLRTDEF